MKQILRGFLIVLIAVLLIGAGAGLFTLAQQNQTLQAQLDESRQHSSDLQTQLDQAKTQIDQLQTRVTNLQSHVAARMKQPGDGGLQPSPDSSPQDDVTMDQIGQDVQQIRGLTALHPVTRTLLTRDELRQHVVDIQEKEYSRADAQRDTLTLAALDLLQPDFKLYDFIVDLYSEQIAGFYEPDSKQLYVIAEPGNLSVLEKVTFAHEFDHALQDQHFDLAKLGFTNDKSKEVKDSDRQLAYQSLVEGGASLLMQLWSQQKLSALDLLGATAGTPDTPVFNSAPRVFREQLLFPYMNGLAFVTTLYTRGGWQAIDAAFGNPPDSSEQILHPERYPGDQPVPVSLPPLTDTLPSGWHIVDQNTLGEFMLRQYLTEHLTRTLEIDRAATGWGGDHYAVYASSDDGQEVLAIKSVWDTAQDAGEFAAAYRDYATARSGLAAPRSDSTGEWWLGSDATYFAQSGDHTLIVVGPDEATVRAVLGKISSP